MQAALPATGPHQDDFHALLRKERIAGNVFRVNLPIFKHPLNGRREVAIFADCLWLALGWGWWRRVRYESGGAYTWETAPHADGSVEPPPNADATPAPYQGRPADAEEAK